MTSEIESSIVIGLYLPSHNLPRRHKQMPINTLSYITSKQPPNNKKENKRKMIDKSHRQRVTIAH